MLRFRSSAIITRNRGRLRRFGTLGPLGDVGEAGAKTGLKGYVLGTLFFEYHKMVMISDL